MTAIRIEVEINELVTIGVPQDIARDIVERLGLKLSQSLAEQDPTKLQARHISRLEASCAVQSGDAGDELEVRIPPPARKSGFA